MVQSLSSFLVGLVVAVWALFSPATTATRSDDDTRGLDSQLTNPFTVSRTADSPADAAALAAAETTPTQRLIQSNNLTYLGMFRLPDSPTGGKYGFDYAGLGLAFNPQHNSLFMTNHAYEEMVGEISIPSLSTDVNQLPRASMLQQLVDITEGQGGKIWAGGAQGSRPQRGGLFVYNGKLIGTTYEYYDAGSNAVTSHFTSGLTLTTSGDFKGMFRVGTGLNAAFYAGYMGLIPQEWQGQFGAPAITGACCYAIVTRTSFGPSAFAFDPDKLGQVNPVPATPLVYYPEDHPTLGTWIANGPNLYYNQATSVAGVVFPNGTATVLFLGSQGVGDPCYGIGVATLPLPAGEYCYDPDFQTKASHAYPYKYWVWAYDANDLLAVKGGRKAPWDIRPYAVWELPLPTRGVGGLTGAAYDPATQRIYVSQANVDRAGNIAGGGTYSSAPVIHAFQVNNATPVATPQAPQNLRIKK